MMKRFGLVAVGALATLPTFAACATFDGPPEVTIVGEDQGQLSDPHADIVLSFSKAPRPETVKVKLALFEHDDEGNLYDEDTDPETLLTTLFTHDPDPAIGDEGGTSTLDAKKATMTIKLDVVPPVGRQLVLIVEPGLADEAGVKTKIRRRIPLTYVTPLTCNAPASVVKSGKYFFLASVTEPVPVQVKLWAVVDIDPATGEMKTHFTKAVRNPDRSRCSTLNCPKDQVCRTLPELACVALSAPAGSVDEYVDYVVDTDPATTFGFDASGCTVDMGPASATFSTAPTDVVVKSPNVTLRNAALSSSFTIDEMGVLRGTGSLVADAVLLGPIDSGAGQGDLTARSLTDEEAPSNLPAP